MDSCNDNVSRMDRLSIEENLKLLEDPKIETDDLLALAVSLKYKMFSNEDKHYKKNARNAFEKTLKHPKFPIEGIRMYMRPNFGGIVNDIAYEAYEFKMLSMINEKGKSCAEKFIEEYTEFQENGEEKNDLIFGIILLKYIEEYKIISSQFFSTEDNYSILYSFLIHIEQSENISDSLMKKVQKTREHLERRARIPYEH